MNKLHVAEGSIQRDRIDPTSHVCFSPGLDHAIILDPSSSHFNLFAAGIIKSRSPEVSD